MNKTKTMNLKKRNSEVKNMELYWRQCRDYDSRPFLNLRQSQLVSESAFNLTLQRLNRKRGIKVD